MRKIGGLHVKNRPKRAKNGNTNWFKRSLCFAAALVAYFTFSGNKEEIPNQAYEPQVLEINEEDLDLTTISPTADYALIRLDGKTYLTKGFKEENKVQEITKYYDINTGEFVGQTLTVASYNRAYYEEPEERDETTNTTIENEVMDYLEFDGEYGYGKNLPSVAILPLTDFVKKDMPTESDINYYSYDSETLNENIETNYAFEPITEAVYTDYTFTNKYSLFGKCSRISYESKEYKNDKDLLQIVFVDKDVEQTIVGYRASEHPNDKGYNCFYDIITGKLYKLDELHVKMLATLRRADYTIQELKNMFYPSAAEELATQSEEYATTYTELTPVEREDNVYSANEIIVLDTQAESMEITSGTPSRYIFLGLSATSEEINGYKNLFGNGNAFIGTDLSIGTYGSFADDISINSYAIEFEEYDAKYCENGIKTFNSFLNEQGYQDYLSDEYTYDSISEIYDAMGLSQKISSGEIIVVDTTHPSVSTNGDLPRYLFLRYNEKKSNGILTYYMDMNEPNAIANMDIDGNLLYANNNDICTYTDTTLEVPYKSIDGFLDEMGLSDLKRVNYTWADIIKIDNMVKEQGRSLERSAN